MTSIAGAPAVVEAKRVKGLKFLLGIIGDVPIRKDMGIRYVCSILILPVCLMILPSCKLNDNSVSGSLGGASSAPCTEGLNPAPCLLSANYYATSTAGASVTGLNGVLAINIPDGYYSGQTCSASDSNLLPQNILSSISIFGQTGVASPTYSHVHRDKGSSRLSMYDEVQTYSGSGGSSSLPGNYRAVPNPNLDDDGADGANVDFVNRSAPVDWITGNLTCGLTGDIDTRIADCATNLGAGATWDGTVKGNAGQGVWKLVAREGNVGTGLAVSAREVWKDMSTGLLWSSKISTAINWCKASGANQISGNPFAADDPNNYCDLAGSSQNTAGQAISSCYEDDGSFFTNSDGESNTNSAGKAGLNYGSTPRVRWRIPTIYDFQQANINGMRFVLPDVSGAWEWTATTVANSSAHAWVIYGINGDFYWSGATGRRDVNHDVRCVGR